MKGTYLLILTFIFLGFQSKAQNGKDEVLGGDVPKFIYSLIPGDTVCVGEIMTLTGFLEETRLGRVGGTWLTKEDSNVVFTANAVNTLANFLSPGNHSIYFHCGYNNLYYYVKIYVKPRPCPVTVLPYDTVCSNAEPFILNINPYQGNFTGNAVSSNLFYPANSITNSKNKVSFTFMDAGGCNITDDHYIYVEDCPMSIVSSDEQAAFNVYPNPSNGVFKIVGSTNFDVINVYNTSGQKVLTEYNNSVIDLTNKPKGLYLMDILIGGDMKKVKVYKE
jgi:hypothetical protein